MTLSIEDIEKNIESLQEKIDIQTEKTLVAQSNLSNIKTSMAEGKLPDKLFKKYLEAKQIYIKDINDSQTEKRVLKLEQKKYINEKEKHRRESSSIESENAKIELQKLKDKYFEFYKDKTRISGMRKMANDFIIDLDNVIKNL